MQPRSFGRKASGFTLVEMAVVLVIIGVIIGAVMIGRDVQRNAEYTRIKQKFVDQWVVSYNAFSQRQGSPIGDSPSAPRLMVNGANHNAGGAAGGMSLSGGDMSSATEPAAICRAGKAQSMLRQAQTGAEFDLRELVRKSGISLPPGRGEGMEDRYAYLDTNGNPQEVQVCFQWNKPGTASGAGNVMVVAGLTPDLARAMDQMIDGQPNARDGAFRLEGVVAVTGANAAAASLDDGWGADNTQAQGGNASGGDDVDQVITLVAHYKMNQ